nr:unnamed protein product [Callosobruchus chinensis]
MVFLVSRLRKPLSPNELDESAPFLQFATWSPDGTAVASSMTTTSTTSRKWRKI